MTDSPASVTVGVRSVSLARKLNVTVSPAFASVGTALLETSVTAVSVGATVSTVQVKVAGVASTLPAESIARTAKMYGPSRRSLKNSWKVAGTKSAPLTLTSYEATPEPAPSSPANSNMTRDPVQAPGALSIVVSGAVRSMVTALESVVVVTAVPARPDSSRYAIEKVTTPSVSPAATVCVAVHVLVPLS